MKIPQLSILIFSFNQEQYIRQTIESILTQESDYSWELIICDDASFDSTPEIIKEYALENTNIIPVLRKKNIGLIKNYYDGISRARGEYVMVCAGDDYWAAGKIQCQIDYLQKNKNVGLVYGDIIKKRSDGETIKSGKYDNTFMTLIKNNHIPALTICFRNSLIKEYLSEVNPRSKGWLMEDYPFMLWLSIKSKIEYIPQIFGNYRVLDNSASHQTDKIKYLKFQKSILEIRLFFLDKYMPYETKIISQIYFYYKIIGVYLKDESDKELLRDCNFRISFLHEIMIRLISKFPNLINPIMDYKIKSSIG